MERPPYSPSIIFSVAMPKIVFGRANVQSDAEDVRGEIEEEIKGYEGRPFGSASLTLSRWRQEKILQRRGYLAEQLQVQRKPPYRKGEAYAVDWTAVVNAGPKYHISSVSVDGGPLFEGKDLTSLVRGKEGDVAGSSPFASLGPQLRAYY